MSILFSGKNKKNIINLSSVENAQRVVKVNAIEWKTNPRSGYSLLKQQKNIGASDKTYNKICVTSKELDVPVHQPGMARVLHHQNMVVKFSV